MKSNCAVPHQGNDARGWRGKPRVDRIAKRSADGPGRPIDEAALAPHESLCPLPELAAIANGDTFTTGPLEGCIDRLAEQLRCDGTTLSCLRPWIGGPACQQIRGPLQPVSAAS
jgi:hypothetical protein